MTKRCLIIAEAGVNHNGCLETALRLCDAAKQAGADVVKFQTWKTENIITKNVAQAQYQAENTGKNESQYDMLKRLELSYEDFSAIKKYCDKIGIQFASTADDEESLAYLVRLGIPFVKVSSGDIGNVPFLRKMGSTGLPVILSTGMSTIEDISFSINALREGGAADITVLHCTTNYPCPYEEVNLKAINTLKDVFGLKIGYSDHTIGVEVPVSAVAMGAQVIEKHFTLNCNMKGPDHLASTEPEVFKKMVEQIRNIERALGDGIKKPTKSETKISTVVTKRIVAAKRIEKGDMFTPENLSVKRNDVGLKAREWDDVLGKVATKSYSEDEGIIV